MLTHPPGRLRHLGAVLALLGLVFASTIASISHSIAMPLMANAVLQRAEPARPASHSGHGKTAAHDTASRAGHHATNVAHDCERDASADAAQQNPQGPCDEGCMLCKDCMVTSFLLMAPIGIEITQRHGFYEPVAIPPLVGIISPSPNEPPRV